MRNMLKYEIFLKCISQKVQDLLNFGCWQNYLFLRILSLAETFKSWKNNERWRNIYWWICYFAPVNSHKNWKELKWNKWIKWNTKKKKIVLFFGSQNQKLTETFAINNSAFTFSFQFKFCNIALCYKMKVPC